MAERITVSREIPARAERIFNAWLSGEEHGKMTGSTATCEEDGSFTAWDGYISGRTIDQVPNEKIVQSWRTTEFPEGAPDSKLTITLTPVEGGTSVTIVHDNIPNGQGAGYESGWSEHYFDPMTKYFATAGSRVKEIGEVVTDAAREAGEAVEHAIEEAGEQVEDVMKAVSKARAKARKQAVKAVKAVKQVQKKAVARAKAVGKKVKSLVTKKKKAPAKKAKAPAKKKPGAKKKKK